jgi:hypothetical protein
MSPSCRCAGCSNVWRKGHLGPPRLHVIFLSTFFCGVERWEIYGVTTRSNDSPTSCKSTSSQVPRVRVCDIRLVGPTRTTTPQIHPTIRPASHKSIYSVGSTSLHLSPPTREARYKAMSCYRRTSAQTPDVREGRAGVCAEEHVRIARWRLTHQFQGRRDRLDIDEARPIPKLCPSVWIGRRVLRSEP